MHVMQGFVPIMVGKMEASATRNRPTPPDAQLRIHHRERVIRRPHPARAGGMIDGVGRPAGVLGELPVFLHAGSRGELSPDPRL